MMKKRLVLILAALMLSVLLAACGEDKKQDATEAASAPTSATEAVNPTVAATTAATSASGNTAQTADGDTAEKDKDGEIVSITDQDGNAGSVEEYGEQHTADSDAPQNDSSHSKPSGDSETPQDKPATSSKSDHEEDAPQIIVDISGEDEYELPII